MLYNHFQNKVSDWQSCYAADCKSVYAGSIPTSASIIMKIFISGVAGFIGFHLSNSLLGKDTEILGVDNLNSYYDTKLKKRRLENLLFKDNFKFLQVDLLNQDNL